MKTVNSRLARRLFTDVVEPDQRGIWPWLLPAQPGIRPKIFQKVKRKGNACSWNWLIQISFGCSKLSSFIAIARGNKIVHPTLFPSFYFPGPEGERALERGCATAFLSGQYAQYRKRGAGLTKLTPRLALAWRVQDVTSITVASERSWCVATHLVAHVHLLALVSICTWKIMFVL